MSVPIDIRALSVLNPWSWALCSGLKTHENRDWPLPRKFFGRRVLIHCGKKQPDADSCADVAHEAGLVRKGGQVMPLWAYNAVGGIVGSLIFDLYETPEQAGSLWATGKWCWRVKAGSALLFSAAIPCKGALGFFRPPTSVVERLDQ